MAGRKKKLRFPRLSGNQDEIRRVAKIIWATFNKLTKDRNLRRQRFGYDVYKSKHEIPARIHFPILAVRLIKEGIDPSLYLKVLFKYGTFGNSKFVPHPKFLSSDKAREVYTWLLAKERRKFTRHDDWKAHINSSEQVSNPKHIKESIKQSWEIVYDAMQAYKLREGEAGLVQHDRLSPWFMAISPKFKEADGLEVLTDVERKKVKTCMRYLMDDNEAMKTAIIAYLRYKRRT